MMSLSHDKQTDINDAFNTTSRYLDDILNINSIYFDNMVMFLKGYPLEAKTAPLHNRSQIYPAELQLNKANTCTSDIEASFLDLAFDHF